MWIKRLTNMKISQKIISKFQEGGMVDPNAGMAPAPTEDPMLQLMEAATQAVQTGDCQIALGVAEALLSLTQGGAPDAAAAPPMEEAPVFRKGGKLVKRVKI